MTVYWSDYFPSTCRSNYTYLATSEFLLNAYHFTAIFTIPLSVFTFYVIIRVTPNKMKNMKTPLLIAHAWSTNLDVFFTVLAAPMVFFPSASAIPLGTFGALGLDSHIVAFMGQFSIIMIAINFIMLLENRHSQISMITVQIRYRKTRIVYFVVNYILAFLYILPFYLDGDDQSELRKFVFKRIPCPTIEFYERGTLVLLRAANNIAMLSMAIHGILSTACMIFIIKPYREFVVELIKGNQFNANDMWATQANVPQVSVRLGSVDS
ncbi:hypothetical protein CAEBREN_23098 [Caenorhabditis brenneri]|uniref:Uncharacterized protein n=1 Tax=Caenorhabditis brenneri TaxID=135651 RepID=G0PIJ1_CAEBE|nr:hypothetical protein CAEBREN_23098 [Caenorhabditis brenneri]